MLLLTILIVNTLSESGFSCLNQDSLDLRIFRNFGTSNNGYNDKFFCAKRGYILFIL